MPATLPKRHVVNRLPPLRPFNQCLIIGLSTLAVLALINAVPHVPTKTPSNLIINAHDITASDADIT